jgi:hypothetical protein
MMTKTEKKAFARGFREGCEEGYVAAASLLDGDGHEVEGLQGSKAVLAAFRPIKPEFDRISEPASNKRGRR